MGFPPVVVGLFVYLMLSRSGPLGSLEFSLIPRLFTVNAMVVAQVIISFPLVAGFTMAAAMGVDPNLRQQALSLPGGHQMASHSGCLDGSAAGGHRLYHRWVRQHHL
jgi:ABC-type tungstate transport system substrate-binding protein